MAEDPPIQTGPGPVIATLIQPPMPSCDELQLETTPTEATLDGCPVLLKSRVAVIDKGVAGKVVWQFRDKNGNPVDLTNCTEFCNSDSSTSANLCHEIKVRFADAYSENCDTAWEVSGTVVDPANGLVSVTVPPEVANQSGLYAMAFGLVNPDGNPVLVSKGYLSVERGLFGDLSQMTGPLTFSEVRLAMRDTAVENQLLDEVEFSDAEIMHAILQPVREWNETAPRLSITFDCRTFPFRGAWLNAICSNLLMIAAHWYRRNKMQTNSGGVTFNDRDKDNPYLQTAMMMRQEWKDFVLVKKGSLNAEEAYGTILSDYSGYTW